MAEARIDTAALLAGVDIVRLIEGYVALKKSGAEYEACCPFHDEHSPSFKVSPKKQIYHCFGCGADGNAISFLREHQGLSFLDACRALGWRDASGGEASAFVPPPALKRESKKAAKATPMWSPVLPVPAHATEPPKAHKFRGFPVASWTYRASDGQVLGYVYRFLKSDGGKETIPLVWARSDAGAEDWQWLVFAAENRPLYGLDRLTAMPDAPVLIVEGEKCADAAQALLPDWVVVSWPGGCGAVAKADWSPLAGRRVYTWADCDAKHVPLTPAERAAIPDKADREAALLAKPLLPAGAQPGTKAMQAIHARLHALACQVSEITIPAPGEKPDGWDVADAIAEGMDVPVLLAYLKANRCTMTPPGAVDAIDPAALVAEGIYTPSGANAGEGSMSDSMPPTPPDAGRFGDDDDGDGGNGSGANGWRRLLLRIDGKLIDCRENIYFMLKHHPVWKGVLWADEFAKRIVVRRPCPWERAAEFVQDRRWDDNDGLRLGLWLAQRERMLVRNKENLAMSAAWAASESRWHPVREYLKPLVWDGIPRIDHWLTDFMGVKASEYSMLVGRFMLLNMVARIFEPGCQMRFMVIFEGYQYRGKSSALRVLGGKWYSDTPLDLHNKDVYQLIQGIWLFEIAELDAFSRAESTRVKAFVSSQTDRFRAPYEASPKDWPREVSFSGSTNQDEYFKDNTGNTRYHPVRAEEVGNINLEGLAAARDQLFAEAVALYGQGVRRYPTAEEQTRLFEPEQAAREVVEPWEVRIGRYLADYPGDKITVLDLLTDCLKIEVGKIGRAKAESTSVGSIMKRLGWIKKRESSGTREWYYARPVSDEPAPAVIGSESDDDLPL